MGSKSSNIGETSLDHDWTSIDKDKDIVVQELEISIIAKLNGDSPMSRTSCIFRVPQVLRRQNRKVYQPDVIAIGPLHDRSSKQFQHMENVKRWYLHRILNSGRNISLKMLIEAILKVEKRARDSYAEPLDHINQNDFVEMMIMDGCFLVQLFRKAYYNMHDRNDPIYSMKHNSEYASTITDESDHELGISHDLVFNLNCPFQYLCHDLLLLENQLPWFVIKCLYSILVADKYPVKFSLKSLVLSVFSSLPVLRHPQIYRFQCEMDQRKILHILDLIRTSLIYEFKDYDDDQFSSCLPDKQLMPCATTLAQAGVQFSNMDYSIMNITFRDKVFIIPQIAIGESTESLFRNLIAFEQCYPGHSHMVTSYVVFMDQLIASSKDMDFLSEKRIIANWRGSDDSFQFFNKLHEGTSLKKFHYHGICAKVNEYYAKDKWLNTIMREFSTVEKLKRDYLSNPWKVISVIAASILLSLTVVQTVYTVYH
ncbi:UPF0481 protein At3g47200-like [Rosa rugosa]|uniref:UPF0481 protein At3g47200-like n=1 Tax=Rosa rugosa TaxID=74645 RepID=UPI002B40A3F2|nr:UPF0481 protein At3g47200-like [Rosa rugosa]